MTDRLDEIRQRAEAATPGPWVAYGNTVDQEKTGWHQVVGTEMVGLPYLTYERLTTKNEDAIFIAHAREDIPYLLAEVERLRAALEGDDFIARCADALHGHRCDQAVGHSLPHHAEFGTTVYRWQPIEDETPEGGES